MIGKQTLPVNIYKIAIFTMRYGLLKFVHTIEMYFVPSSVEN